jgi:group I intron endonuclease
MKQEYISIYIGWSDLKRKTITYVGQTHNLETRIKSHFYKAKKNPKYAIDRAMNKYSDFNFEEFFCAFTDEDADWAETLLIKELNTKVPNGYNLTDGGGGTRGYKHTEEYKKHLSDSMIGEKHHGFGKKRTVETRKKMSAAHTGKERTKEHGMNIGLAQRGKTISISHRQKLSTALKGKMVGDKHPMYGRHHTKEAKEKIGLKARSPERNGKNHSMYGKPAVNAQSVRCVETGEVFSSIRLAAKHYSISPSGISSQMSGKQKTAAGMHWKRMES